MENESIQNSYIFWRLSKIIGEDETRLNWPVFLLSPPFPTAVFSCFITEITAAVVVIFDLNFSPSSIRSNFRVHTASYTSLHTCRQLPSAQYPRVRTSQCLRAPHTNQCFPTVLSLSHTKHVVPTTILQSFTTTHFIRSR